MNRMRQILSAVVCSTLLVAGAPADALAQESTQNNSQPAATSQSASSPTSTAPAVAPETPDQLDSLVAPIALYPDALVAQVLAASTLPDQVAYAEDWLQQNSSLTGSALTEAVNQQSWDPSVKALTQFPSVLSDLAKNLAWTSSLGQAYANQQSEVMAAVQTMRAKAQAAGTLQSSSQITVTQQSPSTIVIQPANSNVVYVPQYNPTVVYGTPYVVPYYTPPVVAVSGGLSFGAGVAVGAVLGGGGFVGGGFVGGGFGWGWGAWGMNWGGGGGGGNVIYNHNTYINKTVINRTTNNNNNYHPWGPNNPRPYGPNGSHPSGMVGPGNDAWYAKNGTYHPDGSYKPGTDTHYGPNGAYHPNGYFGPDGGWHEDKPGTNPHDQPNGGNNGDHGLIGGNGGVEHGPNGGRNGDGGLIGGNGGVEHGPNGGRNGDGGLIGDNGGVQHGPNGGRNGDGGLIGGNGGVEHNFNSPGNDGRLNDQRGFGDQRNTGFSRGDQRQGGFDRNNFGANQRRSYMSGNGNHDRAAADRGRSSMRPAAMHESHPQHVSAPHSGGGRRR